MTDLEVAVDFDVSLICTLKRLGALESDSILVNAVAVVCSRIWRKDGLGQYVLPLQECVDYLAKVDYPVRDLRALTEWYRQMLTVDQTPADIASVMAEYGWRVRPMRSLQ